MFRILLFLCLAAYPTFGSDEPRCRGALRAMGEQGGVAAWLQKYELEIPAQRRETIQVIVVVPVYRELKNGNLARLLQHFREQTASVSSFKLVLLVNNTPEVAAKKGAVWQENQETLDWLRSQDHGLNIEVLDGSTKGMKKNIGAIRDFASRSALVSLSPRELSKTVLAHFDADTIPSSKYIAELQAAFLNPATELSLFSMESLIEPGAQREVFQSFYAHEEIYLDGDFSSARDGGTPGSGAPRIATRANIYLQVGGIPHLDWAECQAFIELFTQSVHFDVTYLWRNPIVTQDRARPDGYDAKLRFDGLSVANAQLHDGEDHPLSTHHLVDADIARLSRELSGDEKIIFQSETDFQLSRLRRQQEQRREALSQVIQLLTKVEPIPVGDLSLAALDDFLKTDWFIDWIKKSLLIEESSVSLSYLIYDSFPGFFGNQHAPVKGPCPAELIAKKRALYRFLSLAREYPVDFPGTTHYLDENLRMKGLDPHRELSEWLQKSPSLQAEARATIQRLLGYSELSNELNVYQFSLQAELGYQLDQQRALLSLIPTDIQGWTTEDWILAKNVTQTLFGGFHFHMHLLALIEAKLGQAVTHTHVQDQLDYLATDAGPFQKLLSLMYLASLSTDDAKVAYEKLDSPEAIRRAMTLYQEMEPYWRENRFGVELNSDWFIERVMTP